MIHFDTGDIVLDSYPKVRDLLARHRTHPRDNKVTALNPNIGEIEIGEKKDRCRVTVIWEPISAKGTVLAGPTISSETAPRTRGSE